MSSTVHQQLFKVLALCIVMSPLAATGCAGPGGAAEAGAPSSATSTPTPTPTPTASAEQFASIITEREEAWREYEDNIVACALASIGDTAIDFAKRTTCGYSVNTVALTAKQAAVQVRRLPTPPAELQSLVARTLTSLDVLGQESCTDRLRRQTKRSLRCRNYPGQRGSQAAHHRS